MAADDPRDGHGDWRPVPDPTALTTDQLRRELSALREIITARLDGYDRATEVLSETVNRTPTVIQTEISHLRELMETRIEAAELLSLARLHGIEQRFGEASGRLDDRFGAISEQFKARDEKVEALAVTAAAQLRAALESADKLSSANAQAALLANAKTEAAFGEQIKSLEDKIEVNTRALDRGEGRGAGAADYRTERREDDKYTQADRIAVGAQARSTISLAIAAVSALVAAAATLYVVIHG